MMRILFTKIHLFLFILFFAVLKVNAQSVGGITSGATLVCPNMSNNGFLTLNGYVGTILYWESTIDGFNWIPNSNQTASQYYTSITQTTCYRVIVQDGTFPPDTSTISCITIIPPSVGGTIIGGGEFCTTAPGDTLFLTGYVSKVLYWQYSFDNISWTNVADTTDTLIYTNITQNTFYRAIVQNGDTCPTDTSSQAIFIIDPVTVAGTVSAGDTVCYGINNNSLMLSGNIGNVLYWISSTDSGSTWSIVPDTTLILSYSGLTQTTWYAAVVQSGVCDADTSSAAVITVLAPTFVNAGADTTINLGQSLTLNGIGNGTAFWSPSAGLNNNTLFTPIATPNFTTNYVLAVTDSNGCVNTDAVIITVALTECNGTISNLFTPDGDGINDAWYIQGVQNCPDNEVFIYNIYGNEVYHKKNYSNDWKGTYNGATLPDGTYYYIFIFTGSQKIFKGSVDILMSK